MNDYILSCCSTADLSKDYFEKRNIQYICFHYFLDNVSYPDDLGQTISFSDFYKKMVNGADTRTSQISPEEYSEYFESFLSEGKDVIHVTLSSGISGSINSACIARDMLIEKYPERKLIVIDSLAASSGYGLLVDRMADLRDEGMGIDELAAWTVENRLHLHHWFFSSDLTFFIKGGRVSKVSGWFGTALHICPLLNVDNNGKLTPRFKVRGKDKVIVEIVKQMEKHVQNGFDYSGKCFISMSACENDAEKVASLVESKFPKLNGRVFINSIGTTIGSHTGPGTVALFFWGDKRVD